MPKSMPAQRHGTSKQDVRTPKAFLDAVKLRLGIDAFTVDLAASKSNTVAKQFYSERSNALVQPWNLSDGGFNWLNPPYTDIRPWVQKAYEESRLGARTALLLPAGVGSNWWRDWCHPKARILLLNGRITFVGHKQPYPKDCALLLYEPNVISAYETWTWPNEHRRVETNAADIHSAAFADELHLEPDACVIQLMTDEAGAECIAAGLLPRYLREQAKDALALRESEREKVPA
jgi:phage N-6-adenine-methyltransferase